MTKLSKNIKLHLCLSVFAASMLGMVAIADAVQPAKPSEPVTVQASEWKLISKRCDVACHAVVQGGDFTVVVEFDEESAQDVSVKKDGQAIDYYIDSAEFARIAQVVGV